MCYDLFPTGGGGVFVVCFVLFCFAFFSARIDEGVVGRVGMEMVDSS